MNSIRLACWHWREFDRCHFLLILLILFFFNVTNSQLREVKRLGVGVFFFLKLLERQFIMWVNEFKKGKIKKKGKMILFFKKTTAWNYLFFFYSKERKKKKEKRKLSNEWNDHFFRFSFFFCKNHFQAVENKTIVKTIPIPFFNNNCKKERNLYASKESLIFYFHFANIKNQLTKYKKIK